MWRICFGLLAAVSILPAAETGEALFRLHCSPCHGPKGEGGRGPKLAVRRLPRAADDAALADIIANGIPGTQMPNTRMTDTERAQLIAFVRDLGRVQPVQVPGDRANGERIFWAKGNCGQCHTVGPRGGRLGPDLTDIGSKRSAAHLRTSLLEPDAEVPETFAFYQRWTYKPDNFLVLRVITKDGKEITGVRVNEDAFTIQLRDTSDRIYSFRKEELKEINKNWGATLMPAYKGVLSETEIQDVIAYLASLEGAQ
jgi:cytochrome c oxidase cbb3-type subunit III